MIYDWLSIDFETRSCADLRKTGVYRYAEDPTTGVWVAAYAFDDGPIHTWTPGQPCPLAILAHLRCGGRVRAWNAQFEHVIWNAVLAPRHGWPELPLELVHCTMATGALNGLPRALEDAAIAAGLEQQKDMAGRRLMLQMAKPREILDDGEIVWWDDPDRRARLAAYCRQDVATERALAARLVPMSDKERSIWLLDQRINARGVAVDLEAVGHARELVADTAAKLNRLMAQATGGYVKTTNQVTALAQWLRVQGVDVSGVDAETIDGLLDGPGPLPEHVRDALMIRREAGRSSVRKLEAMASTACADGRIRGMLVYGGAARTMRWAGAGVQPQNLVKGGAVENAEAVLDALAAGRSGPLLDAAAAGGQGPLWALSQCLRGFFRAPEGRRLVVCDFSSIEARVLAWLAGEEWRLEVFRDHGKIYEASVVQMLAAAGERVTIEEVSKGGPKAHLRQRGKIAELALGYQGGVGALVTMGAARMGLAQEDLGPLVRSWREANPRIAQFWYDTEEAARNAIEHPGSVFRWGVGATLGCAVFDSKLWLRLPSDRCLIYREPRFELHTSISWPDGFKVVKSADPTVVAAAIRALVPEGQRGEVRTQPRSAIVYDGVDQDTRQWGKIATYGGKLVENCTQAISRDLLAEAMLEFEGLAADSSARIILTVHDEIVVEADEDAAEPVLQQLERIMSHPPSWAAGLPIGADGWIGRRYGKG